MNIDNTIACVVMEQTSEPEPVKNLKEYKDNGLFYVKFNMTMQSFNVKNRNKRMYDGDCMMDSLNAEHIQEALRKHAFVSEYGHPVTNDMQRITQIDPARVCGRFNSYNRVGNLLKGEFETFDDGALGTTLTRRILQKVEPATSLRAVAPLTKTRSGESIMKSKAHIVCYDIVFGPSHKEAYTDMETLTKVSQPIYESYNGIEPTKQDIVFALNESMILDYVKEESKNVKLISNICEVLTDTMQMTPDLKNIILREGNETYYIKTEEKIKHDIRSFMSKF